MITKIEFHSGFARIFMEVDVQRSGLIGERPRENVSQFPTVEKVRVLMPDLVRELAPGFMETRAEFEAKVQAIVDDVAARSVFPA